MSAAHGSPARRTTRRIMLSVGIGFGLLLLVLAITSWRIAGQRVDGTEGLVGQATLLVTVLQAGVGLAVALTTIYYAGLTREMVEGMTDERDRDQRRETEAAVNELIGSALELALHSGAMATLLRRSWRWYLPAPARMRDRMLIQSQASVAASLSAITRSADVLRASHPEHLVEIDELLDASQAMFGRSLEGDTEAVEREAQFLRSAADRVRASFALAKSS